AESWAQRLRQDAQAGAGGAFDARTLRELAEDAPVVAFVNNTLAQALEARASDIHVEPGERECTLRFRIDGVLHTRSTLS
ncbi:ATPase, T2SS/T4P/T4SS family, partial [Bacillus cereus]|uniref:ATPase, T2SS/T4P/T4SS family n=1 Tax=Bacillus cereus TaxID=1396 RepID=UPI00283F3E47|nr:type II secretion system protein [Bacillus cereus]